MNGTDGNVKDKSYGFALRVVSLYRFLTHEKKEFVLSKQILRSGTSIGANVEEATAAQSRRDFMAKMSVASKETRETIYWLRLLNDSGYVEKNIAESLMNDANELRRMLTSIVKTTQEKMAKRQK